MTTIQTSMPPTTAHADTRSLWERVRVNRNWLALWFMLPAAAFLLLFLAYPLGLGVWMSFTDLRIGRGGNFIGFENYEWLWSDSIFWLSVFNTLLYTERRVTEMHNVKRNWGYLSSVLMGMSFSAGWVPCIGPILSSIIILATSATTVWQGSLLLAVYSLGLGIPFLITGAAFGQATGVLRKLNRYANVVSVISGIFLLVVAWLLWSQQLQRLTTTFAGLNEFVFAVEESISGNFGTVDIFDPSLVSAMPLAFIAGLISFVSPCVLPLVPAYIGYLSGASLNSSSVK